MPTTRANLDAAVHHCSIRGAASVEAVVVLPVLIIIFVSVTYVRAQVLARQDAEAKARTCAWAYAMNNCDAVPSGCEKVVHPGRGGSAIADEVSDRLSGVVGGLVGSVITAVLEPALDAAFGRALDAEVQMFFAKPALYGGGPASATGYYHLACNLAQSTKAGVAEDAWNAIF